MKDQILINKLSIILKKYDLNVSSEKDNFLKDKEISLDSIALTNFILDLENEFKIKIEEKNLHIFNNVKLVFEFLKKI